MIENLFMTIEEKKKLELKRNENIIKLKTQIDNLKVTDLNNYSYEKCRDLFKEIQYYIEDKKLLNELSELIEKKKTEKYPELLKPIYYPEIDLLNISESEKIRLD